MFKKSPPYPECISDINNIQIDNAKDIDAVMPMYNLYCIYYIILYCIIYIQ